MRRLLLFALAFAALGAAVPAHAATVCRASAQPRFDIAAAAATPAVVGKKAPPLGLAGAQKLARELSARGDICGARASARVEAAARAIEQAAARGDRATAKRLLRSLLASLQRRSPTVHRAPAVALATCPIDDKAKVEAKDSGAGDSLRAAAAAQKAGDAAGAAQAMDSARAAYGRWAGKAGSTPGDFASMAKGAQQLGMDGLGQDLIDKGRKAAEANVEKSKKIDRCTASAKDMGCQLRATAVAQLFGGEGASSADLAATSQAVVDRLEGKLPDGCEEWSFQMVLRDQKSGWSIRWGTGKFRVSRKSGTLDGAYAGGAVGGGWPGIVGDTTDDCIEETDAGTINHGPGTIKGGPFHYAITGSVTDTSFAVSITSEDAHATVSGPSNIGCQILVGFAQLFIDAFVKGPYDLEFALAPGETSKTLDYSAEGTEFTATIRRTKP